MTWCCTVYFRSGKGVSWQHFFTVPGSQLFEVMFWSHKKHDNKYVLAKVGFLKVSTYEFYYFEVGFIKCPARYAKRWFSFSCLLIFAYLNANFWIHFVLITQVLLNFFFNFYTLWDVENNILKMCPSRYVTGRTSIELRYLWAQWVLIFRIVKGLY